MRTYRHFQFAALLPPPPPPPPLLPPQPPPRLLMPSQFSHRRIDDGIAPQ